jgi:alpha-glucosidase
VTHTEWWRTAAIYQIYPLSFADSDGDGFGDLPGIIARLDHLAGEPDSLGVDAVWLSPIYRSPMVDFGYDVADHCDVDPRFGTLADVDRLLIAAHRRGLRVLFDYVPNHTSDQHPWFTQSRTRRTGEYRDFYVWADPAADGPPNNWLSAFERVGSAWTFDERTGQYYLHSYTPQQPDLNWRNPSVRAAMHQVLRFWLDRGLDGFRIDAPHRLGKDALLRDNPADVAGLRVATQLDERRHRNMDDPFVHEVLREIRSVADQYPGAVLVGEVGIHHTQRRMAYHGHGDELQLMFDFAFWSNPWSAGAFRAAGRQLAALAGPGWPTHALSNHDISRHASRYGPAMGHPAEPRARVAALLLTTLPGTTFLYYGEEIGMTDIPVPDELATDPNGRDPSRTPMQWDRTAPAAGFSAGPPWRPVSPAGPDVARQRRDPHSLLALYRTMLALRRDHPCLRNGSYRELAADPDVYAYQRQHDGQTVLVVLNFAAVPRPAGLEAAPVGKARVLAGTHPALTGGHLDLTDLLLAADQGIVLEIPA